MINNVVVMLLPLVCCGVYKLIMLRAGVWLLRICAAVA